MENKLFEYDGIQMKTCFICKKEFVYHQSSIYKVVRKPGTSGKTRYCCSYGCWRKAGGDSNDISDKKYKKIQEELLGIPDNRRKKKKEVDING